MKRRRPSLAVLMGMVGLAALGLAGLRSGSPLLFKASYAVTLLALDLAVVAAWFRSGDRRVFWIGFAVLGWAYFLAGFVFLPEPAFYLDISLPGPSFPTSTLTGRLSDLLVARPVFIYKPRLDLWFAHEQARHATVGIGHLILIWACGIAGGIIARAIVSFRGSSDWGPEQAQPLDPI